MKLRSGFLLPLLAVAVTGCATTAPKTVPLGQRFKMADTDGDGRVTRAEFTDFLIEDAFLRYDRNHDGFVTEEEYVAGGGTAANFRKINTSGTGKATLAEARASKVIRDTMAVPFDEADVSRNGAVTLEEYQAYIARRDAEVR